ncbi:hypothetical protein DFQ05_0440 [Winogradskyella wandonensis]|uniref:Cytochrome c domain-containing protein n=1 Tax=Winogradskyella wandonensis TaxID=1442586 RepID=A0A4R1KW31_9FLAO|nr:hypothetical protein [Winogradskyella wandonensis]TCK68930.1 hypothetical protein DFQ05_0440 [Winogradskyella wandonensis]
MKNYKYILATLLISVMLSCTNVSEEDLIDNTPPPVLVSFQDDIKPIFDNNCVTCHGDTPQNFGAQTSLRNHGEIVFGIENNNLVNRISAQPGEAGAMPLTGVRLPQNLIDLIIQWQEEGLLDN